MRAPELALNWESEKGDPDSVDAMLYLVSDFFQVEFEDVPLKPDKEVSFMLVQSLHVSPLQATEDAEKIANKPEKYGVFKGLSKNERKRLRNW